MSLFNILLASLIAFSGTCLALVVDSNPSRLSRTGLGATGSHLIYWQCDNSPGIFDIDANMVEIESADDRVNRIICTGNPASYQQQSGIR